MNLDEKIQEFVETAGVNDRCFIKIKPGQVITYTAVNGDVKTHAPLVDVVEVTEIVRAYRERN